MSLVHPRQLRAKNCIGSQEAKFLFWKAYPNYGVDPPAGPPTPQNPTQCPYPDKKGTNLLLFKFCIHMRTHPGLELKCCRVRPKRDTDAHAYMIHKAPVTGLHGSKLLPFLQHSTKHLMLALSWMVGVNGCSFGLPHLAACTLAVPLSDLWTCPQTPLFT